MSKYEIDKPWGCGLCNEGLQSKRHTNDHIRGVHSNLDDPCELCKLNQDLVDQGCNKVKNEVSYKNEDPWVQAGPPGSTLAKRAGGVMHGSSRGQILSPS